MRSAFSASSPRMISSMVDDRYRNLGPAELLHGAEPALAGDELALRGDDDRMQESELGNAARERGDVAQVAAVTLADDDRIRWRGCRSCGPPGAVAQQFPRSGGIGWRGEGFACAAGHSSSQCNSQGQRHLRRSLKPFDGIGILARNNWSRIVNHRGSTTSPVPAFPRRRAGVNPSAPAAWRVGLKSAKAILEGRVSAAWAGGFRGVLVMSKLNIGVEIRDFDLERMGFSLSVLDESKKRQLSEAYLRMTLTELNTFLKALKGAEREIDVSTVEPSGRVEAADGQGQPLARDGCRAGIPRRQIARRRIVSRTDRIDPTQPRDRAAVSVRLHPRADDRACPSTTPP